MSDGNCHLFAQEYRERSALRPMLDDHRSPDATRPRGAYPGTESRRCVEGQQTQSRRNLELSRAEPYAERTVGGERDSIAFRLPDRGDEVERAAERRCADLQDPIPLAREGQPYVHPVPSLAGTHADVVDPIWVREVAPKFLRGEAVDDRRPLLLISDIHGVARPAQLDLTS